MASQDNKKSAYAVLGLHKGAADEQIKQAYVTLVKKYDPEVHTERFMVIQDAFNRLKEPQKRAKEDILSFNFVGGEYNFAPEEKAEIPPEKLEQAVSLLEQKLRAEPGSAAEIQPKLIQTLMMRSWLKIQQKLHQEGFNDWLRILELDPTHQRAKQNLLSGFCKLGYVYANHTLFDEAIQSWEKAAQMNPDNNAIVHNLALACEFNGDKDRSLLYWTETIRRWKGLLERNPGDEYQKTCLIEALRHQAELNDGPGEQPPPAAAQAQRPSAPPPASGSGSYRPPAPQPPPSQSTPKPAAPGVDPLQQQLELLKLKPDDFDANYKVGQLLLEQKRWAEATQHLEELSRKFPRNIEALIGLGWAQLQMGNHELAFHTWNRGAKLDPKNYQIREALIKAHMSLAKALRGKNLYVKALYHFKKLDQFIPENDEVHFELANTYRLSGDFNAAFKHYQKALTINPKHKPARTALSELKMRRA